VRLVILTGASGAGKTTIARAIGKRSGEIAVFGFDSIGVPSIERMIEDYGSPEAWQRVNTFEWLARLAGESGNVLFEGQARIGFLVDAAAAAGLSSYTIVLVDCDDETRRKRLAGERHQPELAHSAMFEWAGYLRREAQSGGHLILDTSRLSLDESVVRVMRYFDEPTTDRE
jgi:chloramphenicol 3-O-phosphotransferase